MATVYSLVCWGGLTGKTVTLTIASPCVLTVTSHGLRDGTGLRFKANSDTLPTGLTAGVTYYAKSTAANTFNLYSDAALTTIINTSGSQSGTHILQSLLVADPATALAPYGVYISRYGTAGSERIYDGLYAANLTRSTSALSTDDEVIEVAEAFTETNVQIVLGNGFASSFLFETKINGIRTPAFHGGIIGAGHNYTSTGIGGFYTTQINVTMDGFDFRRNNAGSHTSYAVCSPSYAGNVFCNCIVQNVGAGYCNGILVNTAARVFNNLVVGVSPGITTVAGISTGGGAIAYSNTVVKCGVGFLGYAGGASHSEVYNNLAVGNDINWGGGNLYSATRANGNMGSTSDRTAFTVTAASTSLTLAASTSLRANQQVFLSSTGTLPAVGGTPMSSTVSYYIKAITGTAVTLSTSYAGTVLTFSDVGTGTHSMSLVWATTSPPSGYIDFSDPTLVFKDWAGNDFGPAGSGTPAAQALMVDAALTVSSASIGYDIAGDERPNYNNGGAEAYDIGAYEFDHGYGPHPASHTLTLTNVVIGSRILIRDQADTTTHYSADAAASTVVIPITVYGSALDQWRIRIRKATTTPFYQPFETLMTATAGASSIYVSQITDE